MVTVDTVTAADMVATDTETVVMVVMEVDMEADTEVTDTVDTETVDTVVMDTDISGKSH